MLTKGFNNAPLLVVMDDLSTRNIRSDSKRGSSAIVSIKPYVSFIPWQNSGVIRIMENILYHIT